MAELSTYQDIIDTVRDLIKDPAASSRLATADQIDIWANSCLAEMAEHAEFIDQTVDGVTSVGAKTVSFSGPPDPIGLWRVEIDERAIFPITTRKLYQSSRTWEAQTGEPRWYYLDSLMQMTGGAITAGLWPTPNSAYAIRLIYTVMPDTLDSTMATDKVMLPLWATPGLVWGILSRFYESESRMQNLQTAKFYRMLFDQVMTRLRARSFSRHHRREAYGSGRNRRIPNDFHNLMPADGFPWP